MHSTWLTKLEQKGTQVLKHVVHSHKESSLDVLMNILKNKAVSIFVYVSLYKDIHVRKT